MVSEVAASLVRLIEVGFGQRFFIVIVIYSPIGLSKDGHAIVSIAHMAFSS